MTYRAWLGSIEFHPGQGSPPEGEWLATVRELKGWRSRARDATSATPHWSGQGQVASSTASDARQISIESLLKATTPSGRGSLAAALAAVARVSQAPFTVSEDGETLALQVDVRVTGMEESILTDRLALVTLSLTADDPLRYSAESRAITNGTLLLPNRGDATAFPRLTLAGPHGAISIVHPGGTWTFPALASGSRLVDFRELQVWDGNTRAFGEGSGPAPRVTPGGCSWTVSGLGAGSAVLSRGEAWS